MSTWTTASVLVLNASYEAIHVCDVRRALKMVVKGVALPEEESDVVLRAATISMRVPHVIRLREYVRIPHRPIKFSRRNVLVRDQHACQYCGRAFSPNDLTLDHVVPRSRGGGTEWENVVAACKRCNHRKGDHTPPEATMFPRRRPRTPTITYFMQLTRFATAHHESWRKYLFMA